MPRLIWLFPFAGWVFCVGWDSVMLFCVRHLGGEEYGVLCLRCTLACVALHPALPSAHFEGMLITVMRARSRVEWICGGGKLGVGTKPQARDRVSFFV